MSRAREGFTPPFCPHPRCRFHADSITGLLSHAARAVPPDVIASDRTLRQIALLRPCKPEQLELAYGIGPARRKKYGARLLAVVSGEGATRGRVSSWDVVNVDRHCSLEFRVVFVCAWCRPAGPPPL